MSGKAADSPGHTGDGPPVDGEPAAPAPLTPQPGSAAPVASNRLRRRRLLPGMAARVWWVGVHGGAGETTLATLLPESRATSHVWPLPVVDDGPAPNVVLVARTHASGLKAAQEALRDWAAGDLPVKLLGLVLIADAPGRLPKPLRDLAQLVAGGAPAVWRIPWHEPWRRGEPVEPVEAPAAIRSLLEELEELVPHLRTSAAARDARRVTTSNARSSQCLISSPSRGSTCSRRPRATRPSSLRAPAS